MGAIGFRALPFLAVPLNPMLRRRRESSGDRAHPLTHDQTPRTELDPMTVRYDLFHPDARKNPHPMYAEMRRDRPVCQVDPGGIWAVSRHEDVLHVLKNPQIFSSQGFRITLITPWLPQNPVADSLIMMDPPNHGKMRALVSKA